MPPEEMRGRSDPRGAAAEVHGHRDEGGRDGGDARRIEALNAVTYEDYQQAGKKLAEEKAATG